jgi:hypothetical protein
VATFGHNELRGVSGSGSRSFSRGYSDSIYRDHFSVDDSELIIYPRSFSVSESDVQMILATFARLQKIDVDADVDRRHIDFIYQRANFVNHALLVVNNNGIPFR